MVKVIGILTFETDPGLNRHRRKALSAELSKIGLPILCAMVASVTAPLPVSTVTTQIPLPVILRERASYGYSGLGALVARAFAPEIDIVPGGRTAPICGALTGAAFVCWRGRGGGVASSWNSGTSCGIGGGSGSGISSGGGVGCSVGCSIVASMENVGMSERSGGGFSCFIAATTAPICIKAAPPNAAQTCQRGGGR